VKLDKLCYFLGIVVGLFVLTLSALCVYQYCGLKQYFRATKYIDSINSEEGRIQTHNDFVGESEMYSKGIYIGVFLSRVWIWNGKGIKSFLADEYTVFTYIDGCNEEYLSALDRGESVGLRKDMYFEIDKWKNKVVAGDFVIIKKSVEVNVGNIQEIASYNYLPFVRDFPRNLCAK
jgi:hypothetical protein